MPDSQLLERRPLRYRDNICVNQYLCKFFRTKIMSMGNTVLRKYFCDEDGKEMRTLDWRRQIPNSKYLFQKRNWQQPYPNCRKTRGKAGPQARIRAWRGVSILISGSFLPTFLVYWLYPLQPETRLCPTTGNTNPVALLASF